MVEEIVTAAGIMFGLSLVFGLALALANRWLRVDKDPRVAAVEGLLPGTNCGACGEAGCSSFAAAVVEGTAVPGKCTVSTADGIETIAALLGVDSGFQEKRVARLHCAGGKSAVHLDAEYQGLPSCRAAFIVNGGGHSCPWGCLGLGDCEVICSFDAIHMNEEGLPAVDTDLCTACEDCVRICPLNLFTIEPVSAKVLVQCSSPLAGEAATALCLVACDACGRCALDAEEGAIEMVRGLPVIHDALKATKACTWRCPTGAIRYLDKNQFEGQLIDIGGIS